MAQTKKVSFRGCQVLSWDQATVEGSNGERRLKRGIVGRISAKTSSMVERTNRGNGNPQFVTDSYHLTNAQKTQIADLFNVQGRKVAYLYDPAATVRTMSAGNDQGTKPKGKGRF